MTDKGKKIVLETNGNEKGKTEKKTRLEGKEDKNDRGNTKNKKVMK